MGLSEVNLWVTQNVVTQLNCRMKGAEFYLFYSLSAWRYYYPFVGWLWAPRHPFGRQQWGLERRIAGSVYFGGEVLVPAAPCME